MRPASRRQPKLQVVRISPSVMFQELFRVTRSSILSRIGARLRQLYVG